MQREILQGRLYYEYIALTTFVYNMILSSLLCRNNAPIRFVHNMAWEENKVSHKETMRNDVNRVSNSFLFIQYGGACVQCLIGTAKSYISDSISKPVPYH